MNPITIIPGDIPLPLPTGGLAFFDWLFHILLVVSWVAHILFINVLLGASLASVYFNKKGVRTGEKVFDRVGYLLTTPVTISENMGALWGVAPLLLISVMFTPLFYSAAVMNSPQWLHIIYGNIVAFLLSYLYKFTWHTLEERKGLHITLGTISVILFFSLPPVFMATVQLYFTPTTWTYTTRFWDALLRADTLFRLIHFYLATFAVTGVFMLIYGYYKRRSKDALDRDAGSVLVRTGKVWFLIPTVLNFCVGPLVLFQFPSYGLETFFSNGWFWLIAVTVLVMLYAIWLVLKDFFADDLPPRKVWTVVTLMLVAVLSMATLRHGMRLSLTGPVMAASVAKSEAFQARAQAAHIEAQALKAAAAATAATGPKGRQLAETHGCLGCHAEQEKLVGPAYIDIAKKGYSVERIRALVVQPEPKNWPDYPEMPPLPDVPAADLAEIAAWINSLK